MTASPCQDSSPEAGQELDELKLVVEPIENASCTREPSRTGHEEAFEYPVEKMMMKDMMIPVMGDVEGDGMVMTDDDKGPHRDEDLVFVPDTSLLPSISSVGKLGKLSEDDIPERSGLRGGGGRRTPRRTPGGRKVTRESGGQGERRSITMTSRLDSPKLSKPSTITDYYTRAPNKRKRRMSAGDVPVFEEADGWEVWAKEYLDRSTKGVVMDKAEPVEEDVVNCPEATAVAKEVGTVENFTGPHAAGGEQYQSGPGTGREVVEVVVGAADEDGAAGRVEIITNEVKRLCIDDNYDVVDNTRVLQHQSTATTAGTDSNLSVLGVGGTKLNIDDQASTDDVECAGMGTDVVDGVQEVSEGVDGVHGVSVDVDGQTNPDVNMDNSVEGGRVSVKTVTNSSHTHTHHPTMVKRGVVDDMEDGDVLCVYTDGVCAVHGPATKKWRGGRVWGQKKNGLFGWKYGRKTYWMCEKRRGDIPRVEEAIEEPTFILMSSSKDRLTPSIASTTGGKSKRLGDFGDEARTRDGRQ